jgi:hypothetical protein
LSAWVPLPACLLTGTVPTFIFWRCNTSPREVEDYCKYTRVCNVCFCNYWPWMESAAISVFSADKRYAKWKLQRTGALFVSTSVAYEIKF